MIIFFREDLIMENKKLDKQEKLEDVVLELTQDELARVTGGDDPFANTDRVPEQPIDDELREDG